MKIKSKDKESILILSIALTISIILNILSMSKVYKYKYSIAEESYSHIEEIRHRNEGAMEILNNSIENGSIRNEEILKLYKYYYVIAYNMIELWQQYADYANNSLLVFEKSLESKNIIENDIYEKIKEYMSSMLNKEMKNEQNKLILEGKDLECFEVMADMSSKLYDYFNLYSDNKFKKYSDNKLKKYYWIDMLDEINKISNYYVNMEWNIDVDNQLTADFEN